MIYHNFVYKDCVEELNNLQGREILSNQQLNVICNKGAIIDPLGEYAAVIPPNNDVYVQKDSVAIKEDCVVIYIGYMLPIWGHVLTDAFKKLWYLTTDECKNLLGKGAKIVYVTRDAKPLISAYYDIFALAGIDVSLFHHVNVVTRFSVVYEPEDCFNYGINAYKVNYTREFLPFIKTINENVDNQFLDGVSTYEMIYFSRTHYKDPMKRDYGEKHIEKIFRELGYRIIHPEDHTILEQIYMVRNCKCFASTEGSVSHISIFCKPDTKVVIMRKCKWVNGYQLAINEIADLDVTYVDAHKSDNIMFEAPYYGPFYMCVNKNVENFVGHRLFCLPYWAKPSWWFYMNKNRRIVKTLLNIIHR